APTACPNRPTTMLGLAPPKSLSRASVFVSSAAANHPVISSATTSSANWQKMRTRFVTTLLIFAAGIVLACGNRDRKPLGDAPRFDFPGIPQEARQQFLASNFTIVKDVRALPGPVRELFTEQVAPDR